MPTIRSAPPPMIPPRPASDARAAFFRTMTTPVAAAPAPQRQAVTPPQMAPTPEAAPPASDRPLRPGSIIDIKV